MHFNLYYITHINDSLKLLILPLLLAVFSCSAIEAQSIDYPEKTSDITTDDTIYIEQKSKKKNLISRIIDYFDDSNKEKKDKKFDFSILGGPYYSTDTQFGIGILGAGLYKFDRNDPELQPSNITLYSNFSTVGFYQIGIKSTNYLPKDRFRLIFSSSFYSFPSYYWGIGYNECDNNANKTKMKRIQATVKAEFLFKIVHRLYFGPRVAWDYISADKIERPWLLDGQPLVLRNYGFGVTLNYDSRDIATNATNGVYLSLSQTFRPSWLKNKYAFSTTAFELSAYQRAWKGAVIAENVIGEFNIGNPSWAMMAKLGSAMRGYYEGRYRDKHKLVAQIEIRQHVWKRSGIVVWGGAGTAFHNKDSFKNILPSYGVGYRWEFKKNMNVRLDVGFGKGDTIGFAFNINEAF